MIGVISREPEKSIVAEFFELFKTPWEFYRDDRTYDVILASEDDILGIDAKLIIIYGSEKYGSDNENGTGCYKKNDLLEYGEYSFPGIFQVIPIYLMFGYLL